MYVHSSQYVLVPAAWPTSGQHPASRISSFNYPKLRVHNCATVIDLSRSMKRLQKFSKFMALKGRTEKEEHTLILSSGSSFLCIRRLKVNQINSEGN